MRVEDREKTAFISPKGLYQFTTMPFALSGAPATFQRMMDSVLRGTEAFAGVYLDDIVIYSKTWQDYLNHLREVFQRLEEAHLTVKLKKCVFAAEDCVYLGYRIGQGGIRPEDSSIQEILAIATKDQKRRSGFPRDDRILRALLSGLRQYNRATNRIIKKGSPEEVLWDGRTELAFQKLKQLLVFTPLMHNPDFARTFCRAKGCLRNRGWRSIESSRGRQSTSGLLQQEAFTQRKGILEM